MEVTRKSVTSGGRMSTEVMSPVKTRRVEEKSELQFLNNRLEAYVLRVKEMDDARSHLDHELKTISTRYQKEMDALRERLSRDVDTLRSELEYEIDQKTVHQVKAEDLTLQVEKMTAQLEELKGAREQAEQLESQLRKEREALREAQGEVERISPENKTLKRRIALIENENSKLQDTLKNLEEKSSELLKENADLTATRDKQLGELTKQANQKMVQAREQWKKEAEERISQVEQEIKSHYEKTINNMETREKGTSNELKGARAEIESLNRQIETLLKTKDELEFKIKQTEDVGREEAKRYKDEIRRLEKEVSALRDSQAESEKQFNDLMDVKIGLDNEIRHFKAILDMEEDRVGVFSPERKKRKKSIKTPKSSAKKARVVAEPAVPDVVVQMIDTENECVVIKNNSSEAKDLSHWTLSNKAGTQKFEFPEGFSIPADSSVRIWNGKKNKSKHSPPENIYWSSKFVWNADGEAALLLSPSGDLAASSAGGEVAGGAETGPSQEYEEVEEEYEEEEYYEEEYEDDQAGKGDQEQKCTIM